MNHQLQISRFGGPEVLKWVEKPDSQLVPDSIRIRVSAAGVNFADIMMRMGLYPEAPKPPFTPGYEVAGTVIEVAPGVKALRVGDRVLAGTKFGGYSTEIILPALQARRIPDHLTDTEAAAIPVNFMTAWIALQEMARVKKGDRVLVQSAAGGVGIAAIQIAAHTGANVTGLIGSPQKADQLKKLGISNILTTSEWENLKDKDIEPFHIILDSTGGASLKRSFRRLAPTGRVITFGVSSLVGGPKRSLARALSFFSRTAIFTPYKLMMENKGVYGLNLLQLFQPLSAPLTAPHSAKDPSVLLEALDQILERFKDRSYQVVVGKTFPITEGGAAHTYLQSRANIGKVILVS